ncbi:MAG: restriction endonuclease [Patescibacteria group bacterium]
MSRYNRNSNYRRYRRHRTSRSMLTDVLLVVGLLAALGIFYFGLNVENLMLWIFSAALIVSIVVGLVAVVLWRRRHRLRRALKLSNIDQMHGIEFEHYLKDLLKSRGYQKVWVTQAQGDFGADLIAEQDGQKIAIQAKRSKGWIGVEAIYQVLGGREHYKTQDTMVITNATFSYPARALAKKSGTALIDRAQLAQWILDWQKED